MLVITRPGSSPSIFPEIAQPEVFGRVAAHLVLATLQVAAPRREAMGAAQELLRSWVETRWLICGYVWTWGLPSGKLT